MLESVKDQEKWLNDQGPLGEALRQLREDLIEKQGGKETITPAELMAIEGHAEVVSALTFAPGGSLVSTAFQAKTERLQSQQANPAAFQALEELGEIRGLTESLASQLSDRLRQLGADPSNKASVVVKAA